MLNINCYCRTLICSEEDDIRFMLRLLKPWGMTELKKGGGQSDGQVVDFLFTQRACFVGEYLVEPDTVIDIGYAAAVGWISASEITIVVYTEAYPWMTGLLKDRTQVCDYLKLRRICIWKGYLGSGR